ncbi:probable alpha-1,2-mannosidase [Phialocephala subalpina]|uniref:Probable alpha-1,2-mannosidase n=1 Tax=Phialocephala subalpina TaxID=576137 RepID=A0A1L7WSU1_9HELO|nr:probable alpha-1,2-mannosidase [Phialocephala subalpina]
MLNLLNSFLLVAYLSIGISAQNTNFDPLKYVNQLIGTNNGGNVFAGATLPYGMAKAVADVDGQNTAGFSTDGSNVTGFSHMHDSGTGGNPSLGNFPLFPQFCDEDVVDNCNFLGAGRATQYVNESVVATPGYFALELVSGVKAEMTVSEHAALYHFTFPPNRTTRNGTAFSPLILLDLTDLSASRQNATISVDEKSGRMMGNGTFIPSFGGGSFMLHFCADFAGSTIKDNGIWVNNRAGTEPKELFVTRGINLFYIEAGAWIRFDPTESNEISARVGVSFISPEKACQNAETEIPGPTWDFEGLKTNAESTWREKLSGVSIEIGGADENLLTNFYSAMYRTMMSPQNYTGENPLWGSTEPYYDSFYCIWDAFRSQLPFLTIIDPISLSEMVRSLLDTYLHLGWLPDCRMSLCKGFTQGGSNADVVLADAYVKNLTGIDWNLALRAVINDAENEPLDWSNEGRGGLQSWKKYNYIPYLDYDYLGFGTNSRSISRTLEYSYDDYCVSILSKALGLANYTTYLARSGNWQNLYKDDMRSVINGNDTGFTGFLQPKYLNGTWGYQDPILCSPLDSFCSLTSNPQETFEDSIWEYQFFVPHDIATLITQLGGPDAFIDRLDFLHESGLTDIGNEPSFLTCFLYHYAGRPALSAQRVRTYIPDFFNTSTTGLPGNDDTGAMASFTAFCLSGLFPNPGQNVYFITPPFFESISFTNPLNGKVSTIRNVNFDPEVDQYIQSATLNGGNWTRNWIGHEFFSEGWTLELTLGGNESAWGTGDGDVPPSVSTSSMASMMF